jgi:hypothetical protein
MQNLSKKFTVFSVFFLLYMGVVRSQELALLELSKTSDNAFDIAWVSLQQQPFLPFQLNSISKPKIVAATCFCVISYDNLNYQLQRSGVCYDLTQAINTSYTGPNQQGSTNQDKCKALCNATAAYLISTETQKIADCACAAGKPTGTPLRGYSAVGTKAYVLANATMGNLQNTAAVTTTTCQCPSGWLSNTTNVDGGVTIDGKCKKQFGNLNPGVVLPDGTALGNWGFTWGNGIWAYGSTANGGEATCTMVVTQPKVCKLVK